MQLFIPNPWAYRIEAERVRWYGRAKRARVAAQRRLPKNYARKNKRGYGGDSTFLSRRGMNFPANSAPRKKIPADVDGRSLAHHRPRSLSVGPLARCFNYRRKFLRGKPRTRSERTFSSGETAIRSFTRVDS